MNQAPRPDNTSLSVGFSGIFVLISCGVHSIRSTDLNKGRGEADFNPSCAAVNNVCYVLIGVYLIIVRLAVIKADIYSDQLHDVCTDLCCEARGGNRWRRGEVVACWLRQRTICSLLVVDVTRLMTGQLGESGTMNTYLLINFTTLNNRDPFK